VNESAFQAPFDSCFHGGESFDQLPPGRSKSGESIAGILEGLLDCFRLSDELRVKGRRHDIPAFLSLLKSKDDLPVTHSVPLH